MQEHETARKCREELLPERLILGVTGISGDKKCT
jgi:hypothetical protein